MSKGLSREQVGYIATLANMDWRDVIRVYVGLLAIPAVQLAARQLGLLEPTLRAGAPSDPSTLPTVPTKGGQHYNLRKGGFVAQVRVYGPAGEQRPMIYSKPCAYTVQTEQAFARVVDTADPFNGDLRDWLEHMDSQCRGEFFISASQRRKIERFNTLSVRVSEVQDEPVVQLPLMVEPRVLPNALRLPRAVAPTWEGDLTRACWDELAPAPKPAPTPEPMTKGMRLITRVFKGCQVRAVVLEGEPWFVVADIVRPLGYRDGGNAARSVDRRDTQLVSVTSEEHDGTRGTRKSQDMLCVSWPGLNRMLARSNKPEARPFQDWVFREVLPSAVETGSYSEPDQQIKAREDTALISALEAMTVRLEGQGTAITSIASDIGQIKARIKVLENRNARRTRPQDEAPTDNPTDLGMVLGVSAIAANRALIAAGLQQPDGRKGYALTGKGEEYGHLVQKTHAGQAQLIMWVPSTVDVIKPFLGKVRT